MLSSAKVSVYLIIKSNKRLEQDLSEGTYLKLGQEVCYHNVAYLYLLPNNAAEPLEFELKVSVTNGTVYCMKVK